MGLHSRNGRIRAAPKVIQVNDQGTMKCFGVILNKLGAGFEVIDYARLCEQHHPFRLSIVEGRGQELAGRTGLDDVAHQAALATADGLIANSVSFAV